MVYTHTYTLTHVQVTLNMGLCYENLNEIELAEKYFKKSIKSVPTNPDVHNTLGSLYVRTVRERESTCALAM